MATGTYKVAASSDDGYAEGGSNYGYNTALVRQGSNTFPNEGYYRFPNVTVPKDAIITSAKITLYAYSADAGSGSGTYLKLYANDVDNATAPTTYVGYNALVLTTAAVDWNPGNWVTGTGYDSSDITTIIQEIVNRAGWSSGNAIGILTKDDSSTAFYYREACSYDNGDAAKYPTLYVEWTTAIDETITETFTVTENDLGTQTSYTPAAMVDSVGVTADSITTARTFDEVITESITAGETDSGGFNTTITDTLTATDTYDVIHQTSRANAAIAVLPVLRIEAKTNEKGDLEKTLSTFSLVAGSGASLSTALPMFSFDSSYSKEIVTELDTKTAHVKISSTALTGLLGRLDASISVMSSSGSKYDVCIGSLNTVLHVVELNSAMHNAGRFTNYTLKYTRPV